MIYQTVQKHEYQDIFRICHGVLLIVNKYEQVSWLSGFKSSMGKKVKGIKNCYITNKELCNWRDDTIPIGSIVLERMVIKPITDPNNYHYELKTSGAYFSGDLNEFTRLLDTAKSIIHDTYMG